MAEKTEPTNVLPLAALKRLMIKSLPVGSRISKEGLLEMEKTVVGIVKEYSQKAGAIAANSKRKTVSAEDVKLAFK